jgi:hypothetical protein
LSAFSEFGDKVASIVAAAHVSERHDGVVNGRHPGVEFFVEAAGQEADVGTPDGNEGPVNREALVATLLDDLLKARSYCKQRLARSRSAIERHDFNLWIEE